MIKHGGAGNYPVRGHPLVLGTHPTTFEVTCEKHLSENGNCIIGVAADKGCAGLAADFKKVLVHDDAVLVTRLLAGNILVEVRSRGSAHLTLDTRPIWSGVAVPLPAAGQSASARIAWLQHCPGAYHRT